MPAFLTAMRIRLPIAALLFGLTACGGAAEPDEPPITTDDTEPPAVIESAAPLVAEAPDALEDTPSVGDLLPGAAISTAWSSGE